MKRSLVKDRHLVMSLIEPKSEPDQEKTKPEHFDDETVVLFVERALAWTEHIFPDDPIEKLDEYLFSSLGLGPRALGLGTTPPKYLQSGNEARCICWAEAAQKPCLTLHVPWINIGNKGVSQGPRPQAPGPC